MTGEKKGRLHLLDSIRGTTLISMMVYHATWDIVFLFGGRGLPGWSWFNAPIGRFWQQSICWTFILLSGFCLGLSRHPVKRGLIVFGGGALVSAVTAIFMPSSIIICGILTLLGSAMIICGPGRKLLEKTPAALGLAFSFLLFALTRGINDGYLGLFSLKLTDLPDFLYANTFTAFFGLPPRGFFSTDYFSLLPWLFLFLCGYFLYRLIGQKEWAQKIMQGGKIPPLAFLGRHSLIVYLIHQPVIYGLCLIITKLIHQ